MTTTGSGTVLVVGAGLGGLSAAAALAADGFAVQVFEKNERIGGKLNFLERDGFRFDLGPSIIILPQYFRRLFERAGRRMEDYVELEEVRPQWRSFFEDGVVFDLHPGVVEMERELQKLGPAADGFWSFLEYSRRQWRFAEQTYLEPGADSVRDMLGQRHGLSALRGVDLLSRMDQGVGRYIKEPHLRHTIEFFVKYVGSSPYRAPALLNLLPFAQLAWGLWYVRGGMYALARGIGRLLDELGVVVYLEAEVMRIEKKGRRVWGVALVDGRSIAGDAVVSNMEVIPACRELLGEAGLRLKFWERIYEPAASGLVVHVGTDRRYPQLAHHNFFFSADPRRFLDQIHVRKELPDDPTLYVVCPTRTDEALAPSGHEVIKILPHLPYLQDPPYCPADYEALKQRVYEKLERMGIVDLRRHIVSEHVLVPDDIERLYRSNKGAIYGVVSDRCRNFSFKAPKKSPLYDNLYFVGGSVNPGPGTCMVVLGGQQVADLVRRELGATSGR